MCSENGMGTARSNLKEAASSAKRAASSIPQDSARACAGAIEPVACLTPGDREQLWRLMEAHYDGVERGQFLDDLDEKQWVITLRVPDGDLVGFSTQTLLPVPGHPACLALYSGDTVVASAYRRSTVLAGLWGVLALQVTESHRDQRLFWFLISKGYKTYRFLPLFFREYYPREDRPMPADVTAILAALARERFGERYDPEHQVIVATADSCRLRPGVAPVNRARLGDPAVRYFVSANPGHAHGDELCCLAPLDRDNFTAAAWRVINAAAATVGS